MSLLEKIDKQRLPKHIAVIMDGNGRWAKQKDQDRVEGHKAGVGSVRAITEAAAELQISCLTLYTFSKENWNRPDAEVRALMSLLIGAVANETPTLLKNNIRLVTIGDISNLPDDTKASLDGCIQATSVCTGLTLVLALSYSARWEITEAAKQIAEAVKVGKLDIADITEELIDKNLTTKNMPELDLLIRTGGECRISNFLLWQAAYAELYFTETLWPDFDKESLYSAIVDYQSRERRFGKTSEQIIK